jgi:ABC-type antimicrobial peptide transport system permease subunit
MRRLLILSEFALALTLLAGAGLMIHSFWNLVQVDLGVRIVKEGLMLTLLGSAVGLAGAYLSGRAMQSVLFGVGALDPPTFVSIVVVLLGAALAACLIPAQRAASVDPVRSLRTE